MGATGDFIKREKWGKRYIWVARDNKGIIRSWTPVKGSKLTKQKAIDVYLEYKTFKTVTIKDKKVRVKKQSKDLRFVKEEQFLFKSSKESRETKKVTFKKPNGKIVQYIVQGEYNGQMIYGRSQRIGEKFAKNATQAKKEAWDNFLARINVEINQGSSDPDEGIKLIDDITNIKEGWVVYRGL